MQGTAGAQAALLPGGLCANVLGHSLSSPVQLSICLTSPPHLSNYALEILDQ